MTEIFIFQCKPFWTFRYGQQRNRQFTKKNWSAAVSFFVINRNVETRINVLKYLRVKEKFIENLSTWTIKVKDFSQVGFEDLATAWVVSLELSNSMTQWTLPTPDNFASPSTFSILTSTQPMLLSNKFGWCIFILVLPNLGSGCVPVMPNKMKRENPSEKLTKHSWVSSLLNDDIDTKALGMKKKIMSVIKS